MSVDFEPVDVTQDLDLSDVVRTNIEGTSAVDYDVEYGDLPINAEQLVAPTHNVGVPAEGTLGPYQTDGEGESDIWKVVDVTVKAGGKGYVKDATVEVPGKYPSDVPAVIKIASVEPTVYSVTSASASGTMSGYAANETITVAGASGDTSAVLSIASVTPAKYEITGATPQTPGSNYQVNETITVAGSTGDTDAVLTITSVSDEYYEVQSVMVDPEMQQNSAGFTDNDTVTISGIQDAVIGFETEDGKIVGANANIHGLFESRESFQDALTSATYLGQGTVDGNPFDPGQLQCMLMPAPGTGGQILSVQVTTPGEFTNTPSAVLQVAAPAYSGVGTGGVLQIISGEAAGTGGSITGLSVTTAGEFASDISGAVDPAKITYSGSGTGASISVVAAANADAGAILSTEIVSEGSYARELDGDIDVVAGSGTGGKITVDMEMEEPESGEESGLE